MHAVNSCYLYSPGSLTLQPCRVVLDVAANAAPEAFALPTASTTCFLRLRFCSSGCKAFLLHLYDNQRAFIVFEHLAGERVQLLV